MNLMNLFINNLLLLLFQLAEEYQEDNRAVACGSIAKRMSLWLHVDHWPKIGVNRRGAASDQEERSSTLATDEHGGWRLSVGPFTRRGPAHGRDPLHCHLSTSTVPTSCTIWSQCLTNGTRSRSRECGWSGRSQSFGSETSGSSWW